MSVDAYSLILHKKIRSDRVPVVGSVFKIDLLFLLINPQNKKDFFSFSTDDFIILTFKFVTQCMVGLCDFRDLCSWHVLLHTWPWRVISSHHTLTYCGGDNVATILWLIVDQFFSRPKQCFSAHVCWAQSTFYDARLPCIKSECEGGRVVQTL